MKYLFLLILLFSFRQDGCLSQNKRSEQQSHTATSEPADCETRYKYTPKASDEVRAKLIQDRQADAAAGAMTSFDGGRCTMAQSEEKCREVRAYLDRQAEKWLQQSRAARERGEP